MNIQMIKSNKKTERKSQKIFQSSQTKVVTIFENFDDEAKKIYINVIRKEKRTNCANLDNEAKEKLHKATKKINNS